MATSASLANADRALTVLLVGNYETDRQESMQRFANVLAAELPSRNVTVEVCRPMPFFGRLRPSASGLGKWLGYIDKFLLFPVQLKRRTHNLARQCREKKGAFLVHICDHSNAIYTRYLRGVRHLVTCNDMLAIRSANGEIEQNATRWSGQKLQAMILRGLNRAHEVACISKATRGDLLRLSKLAESQVSVIYMGQNYGYRPLPPNEAMKVSWQKLRNGGESVSRPAGFSFLLHVGGNQWYKNRIGVLKIYATLREQLAVTRKSNIPKLVMIGPGWTSTMKDFIEQNPGLKDEVFSLQDVDNEALGALYSAAELLLFPSLEEGFGWPIIEAQACGCRVVTTGKAPMTEVGGESPVYLDPTLLDAEEGLRRAAEAVRDVLGEDSSAREGRVGAGLRNAALFSTEKMIGEYTNFTA